MPLLATMVIENVNRLFTSNFGQLPPFLVNNYQNNTTSAISKRKAAEDSATIGLAAYHKKLLHQQKLTAQLGAKGQEVMTSIFGRL